MRPTELSDPDDPGLSLRQSKILQVIRDSVQERGYPPSMREIGEAVDLASTSSVSYQLSTLQRKGYLHRDVGRPRTMELLLPDRPAVRRVRGAGGAPPGGARAGGGGGRDGPAGAGPPDDGDGGTDIASGEAKRVPLVGRIAAGVPITADQQ